LKIITKAIEKKLAESGPESNKPIFKLFNPCGPATWVITGRDKENHDILFGFADLGMDCVEFGTISLSELLSLKLPFGLKIERDLHFNPSRYTFEELLNKETLAGI